MRSQSTEEMTSPARTRTPTPFTPAADGPELMREPPTGVREALRRDRSLALGLNTHDGHVTYGPVADAHGMPAVKLDEVLV